MTDQAIEVSRRSATIQSWDWRSSRLLGTPLDVEVAARAADDTRLLDELSGNEAAAVLKLADADGEIDAFLDQIDDAIGEAHRELEPRLGLGDLDQDGDEDSSPEGAGHVDPQPSARLEPPGIERRLGGRDLVEGARATREVAFAFERQARAACGPVEQLRSEALLETRDTLADRRLADTQPFGRGGEAARPCCFDEGHDAAQLVYPRHWRRQVYSDPKIKVFIRPRFYDQIPRLAPHGGPCSEEQGR